MSPRAQGPVWSGAGLHHQAAHANIPSRSSLRAYNNGEIFQPRTEWRIGDRAFSVAAPRVWNRLPTELKLVVVDSNIQTPSEVFSFPHRILTV